jgi:hypothetical protein
VCAQLPRLSVADCLHYTLTLNPDVTLLGLSFPNEQDAAFRAFEKFRPLGKEQLKEIEARAAQAIEGKGRCWWNPEKGEGKKGAGSESRLWSKTYTACFSGGILFGFPLLVASIIHLEIIFTNSSFRFLSGCPTRRNLRSSLLSAVKNDRSHQGMRFFPTSTHSDRLSSHLIASAGRKESM